MHLIDIFVNVSYSIYMNQYLMHYLISLCEFIEHKWPQNFNKFHWLFIFPCNTHTSALSFRHCWLFFYVVSLCHTRTVMKISLKVTVNFLLFFFFFLNDSWISSVLFSIFWDIKSWDEWCEVICGVLLMDVDA